MAFPKVTRRDSKYYLRVWRAERDLSMDDAAKVFRIGPAHWSLLESGKRHASPKLAKRLAQATSQPIETFLGLEAVK